MLDFRWSGKNRTNLFAFLGGLGFSPAKSTFVEFGFSR